MPSVGEQTIEYEKYLNALPPERRVEIEKVWAAVRESMPEGYTEEIGPKFISFKAGAEWYVALANQKSYISLYLIPIYVFPELKARLDASEKKLDCGKSCLNFARAEQLPLEVIGDIIGAHSAQEFAEHVRRTKSAGSTKKKKSR